MIFHDEEIEQEEFDELVAKILTPEKLESMMKLEKQ